MSSNSTSGRICAGLVASVAATALLMPASSAFAQRDRDQDVTQLDPGITITVRTNEPIDSRQTDYRVYTAVVDRDVRGDNGRLAIPRGANVELIVRRGRNNALVLDMDSIDVRGRRYAVSTDPTRIRGTSGSDDVVGSIIGAIAGVRGNEIRIPRGSEITFRLDRPLVVNVPDRGRTRRRYHYHDYDDRDDGYRR
jgi:hypothetical protein